MNGLREFIQVKPSDFRHIFRFIILCFFRLNPYDKGDRQPMCFDSILLPHHRYWRKLFLYNPTTSVLFLYLTQYADRRILAKIKLPCPRIPHSFFIPAFVTPLMEENPATFIKTIKRGRNTYIVNSRRQFFFHID